MSNDVAAGSPNTLCAMPVRLVAMDFAAIAQPKPAEMQAGTTSPVDELLTGFTLKVLSNAYVILLQTGASSRSFDASSAQPLIGRTAPDGTFRYIYDSEVDGDVPSAPRTVYFEPGSTFACFWTLEKELFKATLESVKRDTAKAKERHPFFHFQLVPHRHAPYYAKHGHQDLRTLGKGKMSGSTRFKLELLLYDFDGDFNKQLVHGVFRGSDLAQLSVSGVDGNATYAVARSDALAAMYVAELVDRLAVAERMKTWEDWQFLQSALDTAQLAVNFGDMPELQHQLSKFQFKGKTFDVDPKLVRDSGPYLKFVYECAKAGVERGLVYEALRWPYKNWKVPAREIHQRYGIVHPSLDRSSYLLHYEKGVQNYYDFYEWGFKQKKAKWPARVVDAATKIDGKVDDLRRRLATFMGKRAPYLMVLAELAAHTPSGSITLRKALHRNYLDLALFNRYDFWSQLATLENDHEWSQRAQYFTWVASLSSKLGELFGNFFDDPLVAIAFNEALQENASKFESLFVRMTNFEKRFGNKIKTRTHPDGTVFEADFKTNTVTIKRAGQADEIVEGFKFLVVSEATTVEVQQIIPGRRGNAWKKRVRTVNKTETIHKVSVTSQLKGVRQFPAFMATFGDSVAFVFTMAELYGAIKRERTDLEMVGKVGKDTFQAVASVGTALNVVGRLPQKPWLLKAVRVAGPTGAVLEAVFNVKEGLTLLFSEDSPAVENDGVVGTLYYAKGWVLLGSVAVGGSMGGLAAASAVAAGGSMAAASAAFFTPLGIGLAVGAVVVIGIEVALFAYNGPTSSMAGYDDKLKEVNEDEFDDRTVSRTYDNLAAFLGDANRVLTTIEN